MKLRDYLLENGIQQKFLVEKLKVSPNHVNALYHERTTPTIDLAYEIEVLTRGNVTLYDWISKKPVRKS